MTSTQIWLAIFGMMFVTALTRALFLIGGERTVLPERVQRMLRYAPAAALAAVVLPDVLATPDGLSFALVESRVLCDAGRSRLVFVATHACSARSWSAWWSSRFCGSVL